MRSQRRSLDQLQLGDEEAPSRSMAFTPRVHHASSTASPFVPKPATPLESSPKSKISHADILVYNMSHSDLFLSFFDEGGVERLCRPGYNQFSHVGKTITDWLRAQSIESLKDLAVRQAASNGTMLPIGMRVEAAVSTTGLRVRGGHDSKWNRSLPEKEIKGSPGHNPDWNRFPEPTAGEPGEAEGGSPVQAAPAQPPPGSPEFPASAMQCMTGVYLPLLSVLLPRWLDLVEERHRHDNDEAEDGPQKARLVYLVCGASTPRDNTHDPEANSTYYIARLAEVFMHTFFPEIRVSLVNSGNGILHYEDNVRFGNPNPNSTVTPTPTAL